jgi:hypothetical protein
MGVAFYVYGIDLPPFQDFLNASLHEHLRTIVITHPPRESRWVHCLRWNDDPGDREYVLTPDGQLKLWLNGRLTPVTEDQVLAAPGLNVAARDYLASQTGYQFHWLFAVLVESGAFGFVRQVVPGWPRFWAPSMMEAFEYWYGRNCP